MVTAAVPNWHPGPWSVPQALAGRATVSPTGSVVAGSWQTFEIVYTAGRFGIDDSGSIKVCFRFATDQTRLQFDDPRAPGYVTVSASNGATLDPRFDYKQNTRPWDRTLHIKVVRGFLKEGDTITVRIGDRSGGSPGLRVQTFIEDPFVFRVLADPIACYHFVPVAEQPHISVIAGPRASWTAVLPSLVQAGHPFTLRLRSEDVWGNPSAVDTARLRLRADGDVANLPETLEVGAGSVTAQVASLIAGKPGVVAIEILDDAGNVLCRTNPLRVTEGANTRGLYWADFHAQSGETIGTNAALDYFAFARDVAFLDIVGHQGNDFQITQDFWRDLNALYDAFDEPGRFVALPGYEWSGNTPLGGDRNVFFRMSGRPIRRSSHALVPDHGDIDLDCHTATDLFAALRRDGEDVITFAHVGGRYADIAVAHDPAIETAVEVHSSWGTFEWIVNDAFDLGYRVGIVANSDGHKGRPGAEAPGASMFGSYGGLTALRLDALSRDGVFEALRARRHYATTGSRPIMDVVGSFAGNTLVFDRDPSLGPTASHAATTAGMGDIVRTDGACATIDVTIVSASPVERIEFRRGRDIVHVHRPYAVADLGRRIRVIWSGAEYRGRFRMTAWDGAARLDGNSFDDATPINFLNRDRPLERPDAVTLAWKSITTGNISGFDAVLRDARAGVLHIKTPFGAIDCAVASIGIEPQAWDYGALERRLTIQRLPDVNPHCSVTASCPIELVAGRDNPLFVKVVTEDGHQAWSSPIYAIPRPAWLP